MKLSIITINYNNAEGLRKTLASVASQTYPNIEHIIVDGASTDGSVDVIKEYENQLNITHSTIHLLWSSEPDNGIYNAMNKGIEIALGKRIVNSFNRSELVEDKNKGREMDINSFNRSELVEDKNKGIEIALGKRVVNDDHTSTPYTLHPTPSQPCEHYVQILNSGDLLAAPDVTERMMAVLENNDISILLGNIVRVLPGNKKMYSPLPIKPSKDLIPRPIETSMLTFYTGTIPQDAAFIKRELFNKYGNFDDQLKIVSDWKLYLNMIALGDVVPMYVNIDVVLFDMTGISNSNMECLKKEKRTYLEEILPASVLKDYDRYHFTIEQYRRLKKYHLWPIVYFIERVLFKLEKWGMLK